MATLRDFFITEAADYLARLSVSVQDLDSGSGDAKELHRHSRALRGSAQMAREDRVYRAALGLEAAARAIASGVASWSEDISTRIRRTLEDLDALVKGGEQDDDAEGRLKRVVERWQDMDVEMPADSTPAAAPASEASRQFQLFAAHEVAGVVNELEAGLVTLASDARNRDPLKAILRRQRALLGAARLDEIAVVAEALRATEDMTRVIAKLNVPVKEEWLAVFRSARDVLKAAIDPLRRGENPQPTPALSRLRTLRQELLDRYGEGEAVAVTGGPTPAAAASAAAHAEAAAAQLAATQAARSAPAVVTPITAAPTPAPAPVAPATVAAPAPAPAAAPADENGIVPIETLLFTGARALKRALELQPDMERLAGENAQAREQVRELFDLIRLGTT
jgi:chemotaxis protein histidine kinase CheA